MDIFNKANRVFLWKPKVASRLTSKGVEAKEWNWLAFVVSLNDKYFNQNSTSLIAAEVQMNSTKLAIIESERYYNNKVIQCL